MASTHFARRSEEYADGLAGSDLAGAIDRARRRLRLDELARAADPERAISTEFVIGDGNIAFDDATGKVHHEPIAQWIEFMAQRIWLVAKDEESRAFNEAAGPDQEANRPLQDRLRRDLRLDALHALAFRPGAVFEAAKEHGVGRGPVAAPSDDDAEILALGRRFNGEHAAWRQAVEAYREPEALHR